MEMLVRVVGKLAATGCGKESLVCEVVARSAAAMDVELPGRRSPEPSRPSSQDICAADKLSPEVNGTPGATVAKSLAGIGTVNAIWREAKVLVLNLPIAMERHRLELGRCLF
ncbi:hypothetical protein ACP4OV_008375 [Aristida adscensionis]